MTLSKSVIVRTRSLAVYSMCSTSLSLYRRAESLGLSLTGGIPHSLLTEGSSKAQLNMTVASSGEGPE